jgi:NAD(P)-dependent dehydrogenase (short-subunit alcohol dehydrogenase family)
MKIIVFGSTGGTGLATSTALAAAGHQVTAFAAIFRNSKP